MSPLCLLWFRIRLSRMFLARKTGFWALGRTVPIDTQEGTWLETDSVSQGRWKGQRLPSPTWWVVSGIGRGHRRSAGAALPWSPCSLSYYLAERVDCARTGDPVLLSQMDPRQGLSSWSWASKGTGDKVPGRTQCSTCF